MKQSAIVEAQRQLSVAWDERDESLCHIKKPSFYAAAQVEYGDSEYWDADNWVPDNHRPTEPCRLGKGGEIMKAPIEARNLEGLLIKHVIHDQESKDEADGKLFNWIPMKIHSRDMGQATRLRLHNLTMQVPTKTHWAIYTQRGLL